jgi:hypothetical protein
LQHLALDSSLAIAVAGDIGAISCAGGMFGATAGQSGAFHP